MSRRLSWQLSWRYMVFARLVAVSHEMRQRPLCGVFEGPVQQGREHYTCHGNDADIVACFTTRAGSTAGRKSSRSELLDGYVGAFEISSKYVFPASQVSGNQRCKCAKSNECPRLAFTNVGARVKGSFVGNPGQAYLFT